jgi:aminopeptidase N
MAEIVLKGAAPSRAWMDAVATVTMDDGLDPAFRALCLQLPAEDDMARTIHAMGRIPDPTRIHLAARQMAGALAVRLGEGLLALYDAMDDGMPFSPSAAQAGRRALRLAALSLLSRRDGGLLAGRAFAGARSMTEEIGALSALLEVGQGQAELAAFAARWSQDSNVMDKWFAVQIGRAAPDEAVPLAQALVRRADFDWKTPNRFRSVIGALAANHAGFHHRSGEGYRFVADWLIRLDPVNPQTAARVSTAFETWPRYDAVRRKLAKRELSRILAMPGPSGDLREMAERLLAAG